MVLDSNSTAAIYQPWLWVRHEPAEFRFPDFKIGIWFCPCLNYCNILPDLLLSPLPLFSQSLKHSQIRRLLYFTPSMASVSKRKSVFMMAYKACQDQVPVPSLTSSTTLLVLLSLPDPTPWLSAFALTAPSVWNTLGSDIYLTYSLLSLKCFFSNYFYSSSINTQHYVTFRWTI